MPEIQKKSFLASILGEHFPSVLVLCGIIIFASSYLIYFKGELNKIRKGGEYDSSRYELELAVRSEALKNLKDSVAVLNSINKADKDKIDRFIPNIPDEPSLITTLGTVIRDSGMVLLSIDTKLGFEPKGNAVKGLKIVEVTMGIGGGDYQSFKNLMESMEKNIRIIDVESFAYSPGSSAYSIRLRTYYLE